MAGLAPAIDLSWGRMSADAPDRLVIYASKMATLAGMHPFNSRDDLRDEFIAKAARLEYVTPDDDAARRALQELPPAVRRAVQDTATATFPDARDAVAAVEDTASLLAKEVTAPAVHKLKRAMKELAANREAEVGAMIERTNDLDGLAAMLTTAEGPAEGSDTAREALICARRAAETVRVAVEATRTAVFTAHGTRAEDSIRVDTERAAKAPIRRGGTFFVSKDPVAVLMCGGTRVKVYVGGRVDGLRDDGMLYEFKTRMRRWLGVPLYERVQMHAYEYMLSLRTGRLVESYAGDRREHEIPFDPEFWADVVARCCAFLEPLIATRM